MLNAMPSSTIKPNTMLAMYQRMRPDWVLLSHWCSV
jgi:hypothetical protein